MLILPDAKGLLHFCGCRRSSFTSIMSFKQYIEEAIKEKAITVIQPS